MFDLDRSNETRLVTRFREPSSEFDIFQQVPLFGETVQRAKDICPDCAAPGPECGGVRTRVLVREMMKQILVLRKEVRRTGIVVVRSEKRGGIRVIAKGRHDLPNEVRRNDNVAVDKKENIAVGMPRAQIARRRGAFAPFATRAENAKARGQFRRRGSEPCAVC